MLKLPELGLGSDPLDVSSVTHKWVQENYGYTVEIHLYIFEFTVHIFSLQSLFLLKQICSLLMGSFKINIFSQFYLPVPMEPP